MARKCNQCGRDGADILCSRCGSFICDQCYDVDADACVKCTGKSTLQRINPLKNPVYLIAGFMVMMMGILVTSWTLIPTTDATIIFFPFIFQNINNTAAFLMSLMFFAMFSLSSLLPVLVMMRKNGDSDWAPGIYTLHDATVSGTSVTETLEYIVTTEVPGGLKDSIYIMDEYDVIVLLSSKDKDFRKTYSLPENFHVDSVESDYEDSFLVVKVRLQKDY
ncbi:MAG: hypothetical protein NWE89_09600 [Candidatus Bathyarchaeota archaeon]|nr:hypothetical protein [Candidatus Bathyarchaeota archaeon]